MFSGISSDTLAAVLLIGVIFQLKRILGFIGLTKSRLRSSERAPVHRSQVPEHALQLLDAAKTGLEGLGFALIGTQSYPPLNLFDPRPHKYSDFHWHAGQAVLAIAELGDGVNGQVTRVEFLTMFADGNTLMTVNREQWAQLPVPGEILMMDAYADSLAAQWKFHQDAAAEQAKTRIVVADKLKAIRRAEEIGLPRWLQHMQEIGWAEKEDGGIYRFTAKGAWHFSRQVKQRAALARAALARPYHHLPAPDLKAARMAEMHALAANIEQAAQPYPQWLKALLFFVTLILSALLFGRIFDAMSAAALLAVIFVHELGHLAAMRAFGYRNLSIFFLPFLGAAATGHKPHASPWQEAIVLLAGPVPGIVLALASTQIASEALAPAATEFLRTFFKFALVINLFNLLPFGFLDGGKLFQLAVLGRFPSARAAFASIGALIGLIYAVWTGSKLLGIAMFVMLIGAPLQFGAARLISAIRAKARAEGLKSLSKEQATMALGREFGSANYGATNAKGWAHRQSLAKLAYPQLLQGVPGLGMSFGTLSLHGFAFFAPLVLIVWSLQQPQAAPLMRETEAEHRELERLASKETAAAKAAREEFMARYDAERDPAAKWAMLERGEDEDGADFEPDPDWVGQQRTALLEQLPANHPGRLRQTLEQAKPGTPGAMEGTLSVITRLMAGDAAKTELDDERFALLMTAYGQLAKVATPEVLAGQAPTLDALWSDLEHASDPGGAGRRAQLASARAHIAYAAGRFGEAETWMDRYVASAGQNNDYAALSRGWFLVDIGRQDQALTLAMHRIDTSEKNPIRRSNWQELAGWAELGRGHAREADAHFKAVQEQISQLGTRPWWLRLITKEAIPAGGGPGSIGRNTLDHLAALEAYDPQEAGRMREELGKNMTPQEYKRVSSFPVNVFNGWGNTRAAAHARILKTLYPARNQAAATTGS